MAIQGMVAVPKHADPTVLVHSCHSHIVLSVNGHWYLFTSRLDATGTRMETAAFPTQFCPGCGAPLPVQAVETVPWTWGINTAQEQQVRDLALRHDGPEAEAKP